MQIQTPRIHPSHSWPKVSGAPPLGNPPREDDTEVRTKRQLRLRQKNTKILDQALDKVRKLNERWEKRLTFDSLKFQERFVSRELRILVPFGEIGSGKTGLDCL